MTNSSKNTIGGALIALALFLFWTVDFAEFRLISLFNDALQQQEATLTKRKGILENFQKLASEYQSYATQVEEFSLVVPENVGLSEIISSIEALQLSSGALVREISISEEKSTTTDTLGRAQITMDLSGSLSALYAFWRGLEKDIRIIDTTYLAVQPNATVADTYTANLRATTYFIK